MRLSPRMFRALAWCVFIIGVNALAFTGFAFNEGTKDLARGFAITAFIGLFLGGMILAGTRRLTRPAGPAAALRLALLAWVFIPLLSSPPFIIVYQSFDQGIFESYSALTTTGAVVYESDVLPKTLVLWRCYLAWLGGLASLVLAATVFAALDRRGVGLRRTNLLTVERSDLFTNFGRALSRLGAIYGLVTLIGFIALLATGVERFDALCLALSSVATAGFSSQSGALGDHWSYQTIFILAILCLAGAWNFAVMLDIAARQRLVRATGEFRAMLIVCVIFGGLVLMVSSGSVSKALIATFDSIFAVTTAGYSTHSNYITPVVPLIVLAMIGGATISTAGGIKMPRVLILLRRAGGEISKLSQPSAAVRTRYAGRTVNSEALTGVWVYTLVYPIALTMGTVSIALGGSGFGQAWQISAASLANAGPLAGIDFSTLTSTEYFSSACLMILGRLEVLAALAAIFVFFVDD